jgi:hypothetical protein
MLLARSAISNPMSINFWSAMQAVTLRTVTSRADESGLQVKGLVLLVRDGKDTVVLANIHGDLDAVSIGKLIGSGKMMGGFDLGGLMDQFQGEDD